MELDGRYVRDEEAKAQKGEEDGPAEGGAHRRHRPHDNDVAPLVQLGGDRGNLRPVPRRAGPLLLALVQLVSCRDREGGVTVRRDAPPAPWSDQDRASSAVDFRFAPPWWQTAIGLPDDWQKTLVSKEGELLYDYPGDFSGFGTRVAVVATGTDGAAASQSMPDARVPAVETVYRDKAGAEVARSLALAVVPGEDQNLPVYKRSRMAGSADKPPRGDLLLVRKSAARSALRLTVESKSPLDLVDRTIFLGERRFLSFSAAWDGLIPGPNKLTVLFPARLDELAVYAASGHEAGDVGLEWARTQPERAARYWSGRDFPYGVIHLPDPALQSLLDASIRNIYQAREVRDGLPVFQVGPTCYRGLWVVDGAFILEAMTYLGRGAEARAGIRYLLSRQKPDGSFEILDKYWKENGIVLYLLYRHALLTGDRPWLEAEWPTVKRVVEVIRRLRRESRRDPAAPEAGLMPPGFPDGGVGGVVPEYTNVYWNLAGLKAAVEAARWLGAPERAEWEAELEDFRAAFDAAVRRDARASGEGMTVLPILMKPSPDIDPVQGQWAFCQAVFPGRLFAADDPLVRGNMSLLDAREKEGLVLGTGWMADGLWNYFASFWAHAHLWLGNGAKAAEILAAYANHASPLRAWREEQPPRGEKTEAPFVGDMPHNWASAEFIRLVRNLLVLERGNELHVLEGLPRAWLGPGAKTELRGAATDFGPVSLTLEVSGDGASAKLVVTPPVHPALKRVVVHLGAWAAEAKSRPHTVGASFEVDLPLSRWGTL